MNRGMERSVGDFVHRLLVAVVLAMRAIPAADDLLALADDAGIREQIPRVIGVGPADLAHGCADDELGRGRDGDLDGDRAETVDRNRDLAQKDGES